MVESPVLLLTFNRADNARKVFEKIREAKVKKLYFACDGPRPNNTKDLEERKKLIQLSQEVDWDCELHTLFREENLGCGLGVSSAITWAFENEDRLIVLEDDCVPSLPFFSFCDHCLEKYKDDTRIWTINGRSQNENDPSFFDYDYVFSIYYHCWGWATWKRVWQNFDIRTPWLNQYMKEIGFRNIATSSKERLLFVKMYARKIMHNPNYYRSSWATPFGVYIAANGGLSITPRENLIHNIGLDGVHSEGINANNLPIYYRLQASETFTFSKEPEFVTSNSAYNRVHLEKHMLPMGRRKITLKKVIRKLKKIYHQYKANKKIEL